MLQDFVNSLRRYSNSVLVSANSGSNSENYNKCALNHQIRNLININNKNYTSMKIGN